MRVSPKQKLQLRITDASFVVLFLAIVGLLLWLSNDYHSQFDWTNNGRNTLSEASIAILEKIEGPITVTAFADENKELRTVIRDLVSRYQKKKKDVILEFVSPDEEPGRTREAGIQRNGELLVQYGKKQENVQQLSEETLTNALARLGRSKQHLVMFLSGHGERSPDGRANHDLSTWAQQLAKKGTATHKLNLGESKAIPDTSDLLVVASPQVDLLDGEVEQLKQYIEKGGSLLWLAEPGDLHGLEPIAEMLGIEFEPGVIVDPTSQAITGSSATFTVVTEYTSHAVVKNFTLMTVFPEATGLRLDTPTGWQGDTILDSLPSAWSETGALKGQITFDKSKDIAGPLSLGVVLSREIDGKTQRVAVIGDGDFLSNSFIGNGGNLDLGMNIINWVSHDETYIDVPTRTADDIALNLSPTWSAIIASGFLLVIPLLLIGTGAGIWLRRRKL
ncbi:MAG TPA: ABC transporter [Acidiferrobacteraceae bacterium]|nr:ABC transporter [Acidiferrobacteraceae bacterium]